jgi:hypothetical protein
MSQFPEVFLFLITLPFLCVATVHHIVPYIDIEELI